MMYANRLITVLAIAAAVVALVGSALAGDPSNAGATATNSAADATSKNTNESGALQQSALPAGEAIEWEVLSGGATDVAMSVSHELSGTVGQCFAGYSASTSYEGTHGYWQVFQPEGCCIGMRGDIDLEPNCTPEEQDADIGDLQMLIEHLFLSFAPLCCPEEADIAPLVEPDGAVDIGDLQMFIEYLFITFVPPPDC